MHMIFESVLMLFTQNYPNQFMLDEAAGCQSCLVFWDTLLYYNNYF